MLVSAVPPVTFAIPKSTMRGCPSAPSKHVVRLEVAVHDAARVRRLEAARDPLGDRECLVLRESAAPAHEILEPVPLAEDALRRDDCHASWRARAGPSVDDDRPEHAPILQPARTLDDATKVQAVGPSSDGPTHAEAD